MTEFSQLSEDEQTFLNRFVRRYGQSTTGRGYMLNVTFGSSLWDPVMALVKHGWMIRKSYGGLERSWRFYFVGYGLEWVIQQQRISESDDVERELPEPTQCAPGSQEKIRVLSARAAAGLQLHNEADARVMPRRWFWWEVD